MIVVKIAYMIMPPGGMIALNLLAAESCLPPFAIYDIKTALFGS